MRSDSLDIWVEFGDIKSSNCECLRSCNSGMAKLVEINLSQSSFANISRDGVGHLVNVFSDCVLEPSSVDSYLSVSLIFKSVVPVRHVSSISSERDCLQSVCQTSPED